MEFHRSRTEITIETVEVTKITRRSGNASAFCADCGSFVSSVAAVDAAGTIANGRSITDLLKERKLHGLDTGSVCSESLALYLGGTA